MSGSHPTRRKFVKDAAAGLGAAILWPGSVATLARDSVALDSGTQGWDLVPSILKRIISPVFPDRDFDISEFGAVGDGAADATDSIRLAIEACNSSGGGRVIVPPGRFVTGAIRLKSGVNLHVSEGATLHFSRDPDAYLPSVLTRWEGVELMNYSPLIYAYDEKDVAVTGHGTLDGQADATHWWPWKGTAAWGTPDGSENQNRARDQLFEMAEGGTPPSERNFGAGHYLRPSFIQPYRCQNVLVEGVRIVDSPMWLIHPVLCTNVTIRDVTAESHGPNNDGCNPESCTDVLIEGCYFDTGDDCIAIKSGRNAEGRRIAVPTSNVVIRDCEMRDGHGGVVIGSEMSGGAHTIYAENCRMDSPNLERVLRIKTNSVRGGLVENVYVRDIAVGQVSDAIVRINFFYEEGDAGRHDPVVRNIEVRHVSSEKSEFALYLRGYERSPIHDVRVIDCHFDGVEKESQIEHVEGLVMQNVTINGRPVG